MSLQKYKKNRGGKMKKEINFYGKVQEYEKMFTLSIIKI